MPKMSWDNNRITTPWGDFDLKYFYDYNSS